MKHMPVFPARLLAVILLAPVLALPCMAANSNVDAGFSVQAVHPANQQDPEAGYFDLLVEPGQEQILRVEINNPGSEEIRVSVAAVTAATNRNGVIDYSGAGYADNSLEISFGEIAEPDEEVLVIPAGSNRQAAIAFRLPEEPFAGMLLGGIQITKELGEAELAGDTGIVNQYRYVIAVRLTEQVEEIAPAFFLGGAAGTTVNHRAAITADIHNTAPVIVRDAAVAARILPKGEQTPLIEKRLEQVDMAPNSVFPLTLLDEAGYGFHAGEYLAEIELEHDGQSWSFAQEFVIEPAQAAAINEAAVNQVQNQWAPPEESGSELMLICIVLGCAAAGAVVALRVLSRKRAVGQFASK